MYPDFKINAGAPISDAFLERDIHSFSEAEAYIRQLPYGRNADKTKLLTVFTDNCGTCGTKHAILKTLIDENGQTGWRLMICIFKMSANNAKRVTEVLRSNKLEYIPEAHNYLRYGDEILDSTWSYSKPDDFTADVLQEIEIEPGQITDFKVKMHKAYLENWLKEAHIPYNLQEIWEIREACIHALAG